MLIFNDLTGLFSIFEAKQKQALTMEFHIIKLKEVSSTNDHIRILLDQKLATEGTVVHADFQSEGKGQGQNSWHSEAGQNLLLSFLLEPVCVRPEQFFYITVFTALAVLDFVRSQISSESVVSVKWPNDVYVGNQKIAGILIQNDMGSQQIMYSIVGIGININQIEFSADIPNPVSVKKITFRNSDMDTCRNELLECIAMRYRQITSYDFANLKSEYVQNLFRLGSETEFIRSENRRFMGKIAGITDDGRLKVLTVKGIELFAHKEIEIMI